MPSVSVISTVLVWIPLALWSSHCIGTPERHSPFIVHENMLPRLVKLGVDVVQRDILLLFLFLSPISMGIIILSLRIILSFLSRARVILFRCRGSSGVGIVQRSFSFFKADSL